jgi:hypothetical protein
VLVLVLALVLVLVLVLLLVLMLLLLMFLVLVLGLGIGIGVVVVGCVADAVVWSLLLTVLGRGASGDCFVVAAWIIVLPWRLPWGARWYASAEVA